MSFCPLFTIKPTCYACEWNSKKSFQNSYQNGYFFSLCVHTTFNVWISCYKTDIKWPLKVVWLFSWRHEKTDSLVTWEIFHVNFQNKCSWWPSHIIFLNFKMAVYEMQCFTIRFKKFAIGKVIELVLFGDIKKKIHFFLLVWKEKLVYVRLV